MNRDIEANGEPPMMPTGSQGAVKLITAVVQRGKADAPVQAALSAGAPGATILFGRGQGVRERLGLLGLAIQPEKEVILVVVEERLLDRVLTAMVRAGDLDQHGVGFVFVTPVERTIGLLTIEAGVEDLDEPRGRLSFPRRRGA
jgi:nitrogen regulatory protein P-II 1